MKVDIHNHILPRTWPNLKERYGYGGFIQVIFTLIKNNYINNPIKMDKSSPKGITPRYVIFRYLCFKSNI